MNFEGLRILFHDYEKHERLSLNRHISVRNSTEIPFCFFQVTQRRR